MSLPDSLILQYYEYLTDVPNADLAAMGQAMESDSANPMDFKKGLARSITATFHDTAAASGAETQFEQVVQRRDLPDDIPECRLADVAELSINQLLVRTELVSSASEARRLVGQGAVEIIHSSGDRATVAAGEPLPALAAGDVIRAGRRRFVRLVQ